MDVTCREFSFESIIFSLCRYKILNITSPRQTSLQVQKQFFVATGLATQKIENKTHLNFKS